MKELERKQLEELEHQAIQADLEKARKEKLAAEQRKAELEAQARAIEEEGLREEEQIRREDRERKRQQEQAIQDLKELDERRKRITAVATHHQDVRKDLQDLAIDMEINQMRNELFGPDGQLDGAKMGFAGRMSRYPSREHLMEGNHDCLTSRERKYYEDKSRIIAAKISITEGTYREKRSYQQTEDQAHYFKVEYQSILAELRRQQEVCLQKLRLPNIQLPNYPSPISLKTPPSVELEGEEVEYYLDKFEELKKKDQQAAITHLQRMQEIEESEQQQRCHVPMAEYERWEQTSKTDNRVCSIRKGKKPRPIKIPPTEPQRPDRSKSVSPDPDYLDLVSMKPQSHSSDEIKEPKSKKWTPEQEKVKDSKPSSVPAKPLQIGGNKRLPIEGPETYAPKSDPKRTPGQKQVVPYKPVWPDRGIKRELVHPLGGNTIPIKYSKDIGRNGGIERPTSTEALKSQNSALKAVKQFFHNGEELPQRSPTEHSHPEDLAWDYQGEGLRNTKAHTTTRCNPRYSK